MHVRGALTALALTATLGWGAVGPDPEPVVAADGSEVLARALRPVAPPVDSKPKVLDETNLQVLLSSIDVTVSLIDAYGLCRDEHLEHESCMEMIRSTLGHARGVIDQGPSAIER